MKYRKIVNGKFIDRPNRFIAHVEIPEEVKKAFSELKEVYGEKTREADPHYASK